MRAYDANNKPLYKGDVVWFNDGYWIVGDIDERKESVTLTNGASTIEAYSIEVYINKPQSAKCIV